MYKKITSLCLLIILNSCPRMTGGPPPVIIGEVPNLTSNPNIFLKAESVSLPFNKLGIFINNDYSIKILVANVKLSDGSTETNVDWLTSDVSVATINQFGSVKGLKEGRVIITARSRRDSNKFIELPLIVYSNNTLPRWLSNNKIGFISDRNGMNNLYFINPDGTEQKLISNENNSKGIAQNNYHWSSQNDKIVFSSSINTQSEIINLINIIEINGKSKSIETPNIIPNSFVWSNDNSKIAFDAYTQNTNSKSLYIINADGSNLIKVTENGVLSDYDHLSWSPDNQKIAYTSNENMLNVYDLNLTQNNYISNSKYFCWSSDSSKIIYDTGTSLIKADTDGQNKDLFLDNKVFDGSGISISPDKTQIALIGHASGAMMPDIFIVSADGSNLKNLTNNAESSQINKYDNNLIWSPDSKSIAITVTNNVQSEGSGSPELHIISAETGQTSKYDRDQNKDFSWSPNSQNLVFSKEDTMTYLSVREIYSLDISSSKITRLTNNNSINSNK